MNFVFSLKTEKSVFPFSLAYFSLFLELTNFKEILNQRERMGYAASVGKKTRLP
jgi:hypothetical protein